MHPQRLYREIDVSHWPLWGEEMLGTKPKRWLSHPETAEGWLMKDATFSERRNGTSYPKGDDWSERVANGIAGCLGLPAALTDLSFNNTGDGVVYGIISKSVISVAGQDATENTAEQDATENTAEQDAERAESLIHGNELLETPIAGSSRAGYTVEAVWKALDEVEAPNGLAENLTAWDVFVGYLVLDAIIGNTDRHEENWAVIARGGRRILAPTFDHASCLGFMLGDDQRSGRLCTKDRGFTPEAYADRARSPFYGRPHPVDIARQAIAMSESRTGEMWIDRCADTDRLIEPIRLIPRHRMSSPARRFAERVLRHNCRRLLGIAQ